MKLRHRLTATILLIAFASTSALPAAGIPNIKAPAAIKAAAPRVVTPPKVPVVKMPAAPKTPATPKVPVVKIPTAPKVPVVKTPVVPKVVSLPKVPVAVKVPQAPKIIAVKTPVAPKLPVAVKTPVVRVTKAPALVKSPVTRVPVATKPSPIASSQSSPPPKRIMTVQGGNGSADQRDDASKKSKKTKDYSDIINAYRRQQQSDAAESDTGDPYFKNGVFDRDQFQRDERLVADYYNDQIGAKDLLGDAASQDDVPVAVTRGRIKDLVRVDAAAQLTGVDGDAPELVKAKEAIASGKVRDPKDINRLVQDVANKGVDDAFGAAPRVSVSDLTKQGDALKAAGKFKEARDVYNQAIDALKNGGRNSAEFRLGVIADVQLGNRPESDLNRVSTPGQGSSAGNVGGSSSEGQGATSSSGSSSSSNGNSNTGTGGRPGQGAAEDFGLPRGGRNNSGSGSSGSTTTTTTEPTPSEPAAGSSGSSNDKSSAVIDFSDVDPTEGENTEGDGYVDAEPAEEFYESDGKRTEDDPPPDADDEEILAPEHTDDDSDDTDNADASIPAPDGEGRRDPKSDPGFMERVAVFFGMKKAGNPTNTDPVRGDGNATFDRSMPIVDKKPGLIGNPGTAGAAGRPSSIPQGTPIQQNPGNIDPDRNDNSTTTGGRKSGPLPPKPGGGV